MIFFAERGIVAHSFRMASHAGNRIFTSVAAFGKTEKLILKTRKGQHMKVDVEKCKEYITTIADRMRTEPPKEEADEVERRMSIFRCIDKETNKVMAPTSRGGTTNFPGFNGSGRILLERCRVRHAIISVQRRRTTSNCGSINCKWEHKIVVLCRVHRKKNGKRSSGGNCADVEYRKSGGRIIQ